MPIHYSFKPPKQPVLEVITHSTTPLFFPIHRIYCVGRNYKDHIQEMGGNPKSSRPTFFTKPADAVVPSGSTISYPLSTKNLHYEVEWVVAMGEEEQVYGYAVGVDLTRRDWQSVAKREGLPWDVSKAFDESAPVGRITRVEDVKELGDISLTVNGVMKQSASLSEMIWSVPEIIEELGKFFVLQPGDLIFTGTPAGVGALEVGDRVCGSVDGLENVQVTIGARKDSS